MRITRADLSSSVRSNAEAVSSRYAFPRSYDRTAPIVAVGAPLLATVVVLLSRLIFQG